jgi:LPXTG-motif cell wall-anchored protein
LSGVVTFGLGCSTVSASVVGGVPKASGSGSVASLGVNSSTALQPLGAVTTQIGSALSTILGQICSGGRQLCPVTTTVSDLLTSVLNTKTLDVQLGNSVSTVTVETSKVTSATSASGAVIKILPLPVVNGVASTTPFVTITVGSAKASVVYDRTTGVATPIKDPAIVRINFNTALNAAGLPAEIAVPVGQTKTILLGTPLETTITVADGTARVNADRTATATADGVKVELFKGLQGGIVLNLAHAEAAGGGAPATKDAPAPPPNAELPRTGGTPWLPIAGAGFLGLAVLVRRATVKAVRA